MDNPKNFSIKELLAKGWAIFRAQMSTVLLLEMVGLLFFGMSFFGAQYLVARGPLALQVVGHILLGVGQLVVSIAVIHIALKLAKERQVDLYDLVARIYCILGFFLSSILYLLVIILGLAIFIIPGIIFAVRFSLFPYYIVDKSSGPIRALEQSWDAVKGASWKVFLMSILCSAINLLGILCFGVGLLFTLPITMVASALMYRTLHQQTYPNEP